MAVDRPIATRSDDRLRRSGFADAIARQILAADPDDSMVMAVTGAWGSGKTSVLNMVTEVVRREDDRVVILTFNPWMFSGAEQLTARYFAEIAAELRSSGQKRLKKVADRMVDYGERLRPLADLIAEAPGAAPVAKGAQKAVVAAGVALRGLDRLGSDSIIEQRNAISDAINKQELRFLVVIDDIDRLREVEVLEIVRMVRLVADFPRTTFLLSYDRARVEEVLGAGDSAHGRDYLEKIVQESHDLPEVRPEDLSPLFLEAVDKAIDGVEAGPFDRNYWANVYASAVRPMIRTPRDAVRVARAIPAAVRAVGTEVNLTDVIALETFRILAPDVYARIRQVSDLLTHTDPGYIGLGARDDVEGKRSRLKDFINTDDDSVEATTELCRLVFPGSRAYIDNHLSPSEYQQTWRRARRVANLDVLNIYLHRLLPPGRLSADAVEAAFGLLARPEQLSGFLEQLDEATLEHLLVRLEDFHQDFPVPSPELLAALYNLLPGLRIGRRGFFDVGSEIQLERIVLRLIWRIVDQDARATVVEAALQSISNLAGRLALVRMVGYEENVGQELVTVPAARGLTRQVMKGIRDTPGAALSGERNIHVILGWYAKHGTKRDRAHVSKLLADDDFLVAVLRSSLGEGAEQSLDSVVVERTVDVPWVWITGLANDSTIDERVRRLAQSPPEGIDDRGREALGVALEYVDRVREVPNGRTTG